MAQEEKEINNYIKLLWWPIILTLVFEIAALFTDNASVLIIVADVFLVIYMIVKTQINSHKTAAWLCGLIIGSITFLVSLADCLLNFKFYYIFNEIGRAHV